MSQTANEEGKWDTLAPVHGHRPHDLAVARELNDRGEKVASFELGDCVLDVIRGREVIWLITRIAKGGVAMRGIYSPDGDLDVDSVERRPNGLSLRVNGTTMGQFRAELTFCDAAR